MSRLVRLLVPGLLAVAVYYAVFGGEYSLFELQRARAAVVTERAALAELRFGLDSLTAWVDSLETDSGVLERVARERFGMIKEGETLYRFAEVDDPSATEPPEGASR